MNVKKTLILVIAVLAVLLVVCGVFISLFIFGGDEGPMQGATADEPEYVTEQLQLCVVDTEYGQLCYQDKWSAFMQVDQQMNDGILTVSYSAFLQEQSYPLFELIIGGTEPDAPATLVDAQGVRRNVNVNMEEFLEHPELDEDNQRLLYAMQEDINIIIDNLK